MDHPLKAGTELEVLLLYGFIYHKVLDYFPIHLAK